MVVVKVILAIIGGDAEFNEVGYGLMNGLAREKLFIEEDDEVGESLYDVGLNARWLVIVTEVDELVENVVLEEVLHTGTGGAVMRAAALKDEGVYEPLKELWHAGAIDAKEESALIGTVECGIDGLPVFVEEIERADSGSVGRLAALGDVECVVTCS